MAHKQILRALLGAAIVLIVLCCTLLALGRLLAALGDFPAATVVDYIALGAGVAFAVDLVCLVLVQAGLLSGPGNDPPEEGGGE